MDYMADALYNLPLGCAKSLSQRRGYAHMLRVIQYRTPATRFRSRRRVTAQQFEPRVMKLSLLTAALQELTPRDKRDADPDLAIEEWLQFARQIGCPDLELFSAFAPTESEVAAA